MGECATWGGEATLSGVYRGVCWIAEEGHRRLPARGRLRCSLLAVAVVPHRASSSLSLCCFPWPGVAPVSASFTSSPTSSSHIRVPWRCAHKALVEWSQPIPLSSPPALECESAR